MNLKKYSCHTFALLLFCGCTYEHAYIRQEKKGYYTQNPYKLGGLESFEKTIILQTPDAITDFRKKLATGIPKWHTSGTEKKPYELWNDFFNKEILENIVKKLKEKEEEHDIMLLENYYDKWGNLFKEPSAENEKEVIAAIKQLQANPKLMQAWKMCIAARCDKLETIYLTESTLSYQEFLYFILEKNNRLYIKLKNLQSNLAKWKEDGRPTGQELWKAIEQKYSEQFKDAQVYAYPQNQQAIKESLRLIDQLEDDPYSLSYKDLLETLPHGIKQLKDTLYEVGLEEADHVKVLKTYLALVSSLYIAYLD